MRSLSRRTGIFWTSCLWLLLASQGVAAEKKLRLEQIFSEHGLTGPSPTQLRWRPDGRLLTYILPQQDGEGRDLWSVDPASGEKQILISGRELERLAPAAEKAPLDERERERRLRYSVAAYLWSPDSQSILFTSSGRLYLYHLASRRARAVVPEKQGVRDAKFSPNGRWISFLYEHDIWLVPSSGGEERRLTTGASGALFHGDLDWVYPEEFGVRTGYHWSPDSGRIAFLELDQSRVPAYPIADLAAMRPAVDFQRYPKAGDPNPRVRVGIVEAKPGGRKEMRAVWLDRTAEYTPRVAWVDERRLAVQFLNRPQNRLELLFADATNGRTRTVLVEQDPYWINITDDWRFLRGTQELLWTSERTGFRHIELHDFLGEKKRSLTEGEWEVSAVEGVDHENGWVYYTANEDNPLGKDLYRVRLDGSGKERLTTGKGVHSVVLNPPATAFADQYSALTEVPRLEVRHLSGDGAAEVHRANSLEGYRLAQPELLQWEAPDNQLIRGLLLKPRSLEPARKYPVVMYVYGGPHAPTIRDAWDSRGRYLFHQYLVQNGYVVFYVDDRASSILGHRYEAAIHRNYGPAALEDYLAAVKQIQSLPFVDPERIAVWGWSGGGFSTCFALTHSDVFKVGIAVAPVTDWRLYDSIYTERYMGHPDKEKAAYAKTSAVEAAKHLSGRLLLVHGTADDNVHIQNTMRMIDALIEAGKPYDLLIYPGKTHSIHGPSARLHLFRSMADYLKSHL